MCILSNNYDIQSKIENYVNNNNGTTELLNLGNINNIEDRIDNTSIQLIESEVYTTNPNEFYDTMVTVLVLVLLSYLVVNDVIM